MLTKLLECFMVTLSVYDLTEPFRGPFAAKKPPLFWKISTIL